MQTNNNITLFNPYITDHETVYFGCKIWNVWAISRERIDLDINAEFNLSRVIVRVPLSQAVFSKEYISPHQLLVLPQYITFFSFSLLSL